MKVEYRRIDNKVGMEIVMRKELPNGTEALAAMHVSNWDVLTEKEQDMRLVELSRELERAQTQKMNTKLRVGDTCKKLKGYVFNGVVRAVFTTLKGEERLVVELLNLNDDGNGNGMLHIFSPEQLEKTYE